MRPTAAPAHTSWRHDILRGSAAKLTWCRAIWRARFYAGKVTWAVFSDFGFDAFVVLLSTRWFWGIQRAASVIVSVIWGLCLVCGPAAAAADDRDHRGNVGCARTEWWTKTPAHTSYQLLGQSHFFAPQVLYRVIQKEWKNKAIFKGTQTKFPKLF